MPTDSLTAIDTSDLMYIRKAAILTDTILKKGVYTSFNAFRNNVPNLLYSWGIDETGEKMLLIVDETGEQPRVQSSDKVWGFSDGEKVYIYHDGYYYAALTFKDRKALFEGFDTQKRDENAAKGALFFGLIGAAVGSMTKADSVIYELDTDNGEIIIKEPIKKKK